MNIFPETDYAVNNGNLAEILDKTAKNVVELMLLRGIKISFAESCTGGLLSSVITDIPGVSECYEYGICTYSDRIKNKILGVPLSELEAFTAVSQEVALSMAKGLREISGAEICVSVTGIAGPGGGTEKTPLGTVFVGMYLGNILSAQKLQKLYELLDKSRSSIRFHTALAVFLQLQAILNDERLLQKSGIIK